MNELYDVVELEQTIVELKEQIKYYKQEVEHFKALKDGYRDEVARLRKELNALHLRWAKMYDVQSTELERVRMRGEK